MGGFDSMDSWGGDGYGGMMDSMAEAHGLFSDSYDMMGDISGWGISPTEGYTATAGVNASATAGMGVSVTSGGYVSFDDAGNIRQTGSYTNTAVTAGAGLGAAPVAGVQTGQMSSGFNAGLNVSTPVGSFSAGVSFNGPGGQLGYGFDFSPPSASIEATVQVGYTDASPISNHNGNSAQNSESNGNGKSK